MNGTSQPKLAVDAPSPKVVGQKLGVRCFDRAFLPFAFSALLVSTAFAFPLASLLRYSVSVELYSHIPLIPFICGYLIYIDRAMLPRPGRSFLLAGLVALAGCAVLMVYFSITSRLALSLNDKLSFVIFGYFLCILASAFAFLGSKFVQAVAFPAAFFLFIVPFPEVITNALEIGSQKASAEVYAWMMSATGATYLRDGQVFELPGLVIKVAQECSGIRSSFVLFLTSLLAGHMFLRSPWKKAFLAFFVIPLGLVRNAFRVYVISMLSAHWNPEVIHSPLHHRGGPIFFVLSLVPFFLLLMWLRKTEGQSGVAPSQSAS